MTIPFNNIPANLRTPLFFAEIDPSHANTAVDVQRTLLIGQKRSAGVATPNVPVPTAGLNDTKVRAGAGSILAQMMWAYTQTDSEGEVWLLPLSDDGAATAASGSVSFTGPATAAGTLTLYIAGIRVQTLVTAAMTASQLATAVVAACALLPDLPVTAAVDGTNTFQVNFTARNLGEASNDIWIYLNFGGSRAGEATPAGIAVSIVGSISANGSGNGFTGGATNPTLTTALGNCADMPFDFIVMPYTDSTSTAALTAFLNDTTGRWSWNVQVFGHCFIAKRATYSGLITFGATLNDQHLTCMGFQSSPHPNWVWAAMTGGACAVSARADPGLPTFSIALPSLLGPNITQRFTQPQRNALLYSGVSTFNVDAAGLVHLEKIITTYQLNTAGAADNSYLAIQTMFLLTFVLRALRSRVLSVFSRKKLAANGTRFAPGSNIVTPNIIKADQIATYRDLEFDGFVQQSDVFAANIVVEQDSSNPNRVNVLWPGILIDQLDIFALLAQFRLQ